MKAPRKPRHRPAFKEEMLAGEASLDQLGVSAAGSPSSEGWERVEGGTEDPEAALHRLFSRAGMRTALSVALRRVKEHAK